MMVPRGLRPPQGGGQAAVQMEWDAADLRRGASAQQRERLRAGARFDAALGFAAQKRAQHLERLGAETAHLGVSIEWATGVTGCAASELEDDAASRVAASEQSTAEKHAELLRQQRRREGAALQAAQSRAAWEAHAVQTESEIQRAGDTAKSAVKRSVARVDIDLEAKQRQEELLQKHFHEDALVAQVACANLTATAAVKGTAARRRAEEVSRRAAAAVAIAKGRGEAMLADGNFKADKYEAAASIQAAEAARLARDVRLHCDLAVGVALRGSAQDLAAARERCRAVKEGLAERAAEYRAQMLELEHGASANVREAERKIKVLNAERLEVFVAGQDAVTASRRALQGRRDESEAAIDGVYHRLQEVERETREAADRIVRQLLESSREAEAEVRRLEALGQAAIARLHTEADECIRTRSDEHHFLQERGHATVIALERQGDHVLNAAGPTSEAARAADDQAARIARARIDELKAAPVEIAAAADKESEHLAREADSELGRLQAEADGAVAAWKAAQGEAQREEGRLQKGTAEASERLRVACHRLRAANLHDVARAISEPLPCR